MPLTRLEFFISNDDILQITTTPELFGDISIALEKEGLDIEGEVSLIPINTVNIAGSDAKQLLELIEKLESHEDIQKVYSNFDIDEATMESLL